MTYTYRTDAASGEIEMSDVVLCESADGWSLHAPGSTDEAIACGDAPALVTGEGEPTDLDYALASVIAAGEWAAVDSSRERRDLANGGWLTIFEAGVPVLRRGQMP